MWLSISIIFLSGLNQGGFSGTTDSSGTTYIAFPNTLPAKMLVRFATPIGAANTIGTAQKSGVSSTVGMNVICTAPYGFFWIVIGL